DTAFMRSETYHTKNDTYEKLNYDKMKEVVDATLATVLSL
ncbi:MAG TPA: peptidase M28, partial [Flavobacteriaceae bacterium]|nr:peptidase M28 [Flavobacteriaceae bacterium]